VLVYVWDKGGMAAAIDSGMPKLMIEESAAKKQARIDSGQETVVGVNKYVSDADTVDVLAIDNAAVRAKQVARLESIRASRDENKVQQALDALRESAKLTESTGSGEHPQNLLALVSVVCLRCSARHIFVAAAPLDVHLPCGWIVVCRSRSRASHGRRNFGCT